MYHLHCENKSLKMQGTHLRSKAHALIGDTYLSQFKEVILILILTT